MEIDRVLRPGGYWVLSGPPINWKNSYKGWGRTAQDLEEEQLAIESLAKRLCWKKTVEKGPIAVWRKPTNHVHCLKKSKILKSPPFCAGTDPDAAWFVNIHLPLYISALCLHMYTHIHLVVKLVSSFSKVFSV